MGNTQQSTIVLTDDGLRLRKVGKTSSGMQYVCQENPEHIAYTIAIKKERQLIREINVQKYT